MSDNPEAFDPGSASDRDLDECFDVRAAAVSTDLPEDPPPTRDGVVGSMRKPPPEWGQCKYWVSRRDGHIVAMMRASFPTEENTTIAFAEVCVHPRNRRQGLGAALLRVGLAEMRDRDRTTIVGAGLKAGGPGEKWALELGFRESERLVIQLLPLTTLDRRQWPEQIDSGYRLEQWRDASPPDLVASYGRARLAIDDAPRGDRSFQTPNWSVSRVRKLEQEYRELDHDRRVVAAVDRANHEVVGFTELTVYPHRSDIAFQGDTVVVPAHRGRGLGRSMKGANLQWLLAELPNVKSVVTNTDAANVHMIRINHSVGFHDLRTTVWVEVDTADLERRLSR